MTEIVFLDIKRRFGPSILPFAWYRGLCEYVLTGVVYNLKQFPNSDPYAIIGFNKAAVPKDQFFRSSIGK